MEKKSNYEILVEREKEFWRKRHDMIDGIVRELWTGEEDDD